MSITTGTALRCFYCDRITRDENAVSIRLTTGLLSCVECTAHDSGVELVKVHGWDGEYVLVDRGDIDAVCATCGSKAGEPCA